MNKIGRPILVGLLFLLKGYLELYAQDKTQTAPQIAVQSGFSQESLSFFEFSGNNKYLYGRNEANEHIIWDVATMKQIKRITAPLTKLPSLLYLPQASFSKDSKKLLIPDFPAGEFILYDLQANKEVYVFAPPEQGLYYTHALFSELGDKILLVLQSNGAAGIYGFEVRKNTGELESRTLATIEHPYAKISEGTKLLIKKSIELNDQTALLTKVAIDDNCKRIAVVTTDKRCYKFPLVNSLNAKLTVNESFEIPRVSRVSEVGALRFVGEDIALLLKGDIKLKDKTYYFSKDTLLYLTAEGFTNPRRKLSNTIVPVPEKRSNILSVETITTDTDLSLYFDDKVVGNDHQIVAKDFFSDQVIFSYMHGEPTTGVEAGLLKSGQFNGGKLVAISRDRSLIAECSINMVIHSLRTNTIAGQFSPLKGNLSLFDPVFIDTSLIYFPKLSQNGFLLNLKDGRVQSIGPAVTCMDTTYLGSLSFGSLRPIHELGMRTTAFNSANNSIFQLDYRPLGLCGTADSKLVIERPLDFSKPVKQTSIKQYQETYFVLPIPTQQQYIVNSSLYDWKDKDMKLLAELAIREKRDSFFAIMPQVIDNNGTIVAVLCSRKPKGTADLYVAYWDKTGKLLEKIKITRKESKIEYQSFLFEVAFSPDKKHLVYVTLDGAIGVFSLEQRKLLYETKLSDGFTVKVNGLFKSWLNTTVNISATAACFTSNENFVTTGADARIIEWSVKTSVPIRQVNQNERYLFYTVNLSPDRKYLYGVEGDKTVKFLDYKTGELVFQFLSTDYSSYLLVNREGYYMTNKNSVNNLAYLYNGSTYNYSQFDAILNRPDKVLTSIGYLNTDSRNSLQKAYEMRLKRTGIKTVEIPIQSAPKISIGTNDIKNQVESASVQVIVKGQDVKSPIERIWVRVNGVAVFGTKGRPVKSTVQQQGYLMETTLSLPLMVGKNDIEISLGNSSGIESTREYLSINRKAAIPQRTVYLVAIGSSKFKDAARNLQFADKDSKDILAYFKQNPAPFQAIVPINLVNEQVTREKVLAIKKELLKTSVDDVVMIYFAGHGLISQSLDYYLSTYDIDFSAPEKRGLSMYDLEGILDSIPARNRIVFLDACHSGDFDKEERKQEEKQRTVKGNVVFGTVQQQKTAPGLTTFSTYELMRQYFLEGDKGIGANILSSSSSREFSWEEGTVKNGLFTHCLLEGLKSFLADENKDGVIDLSELQIYVARQVSLLSEGRQQPVTRAENQFSNLVLRTR
ncbi:caspase family protein [Flavihumibacter sp. CACIAM 22H1]|uniref:caspase family protein n=1 Tax=Flavihumibacter sp. CACIAM 22H1 TaxID=1812911 RepID=UPI0007A8FDF0|nr:caspase family protein [Flavihumibacter sp. CACIAM 22H1]KYP14385.1 MAG: hypothetical protein A1D16_17760 [Flavihumibacter sp. CACIAM 22H1]